MKRIILTAILLVALPLGMAANAPAKVKVLESSAKKVPSWVGASQNDYIITSAVDADLETARNKCLDNVRRFIIESVAQNVQSSSQSTISQTVLGNQITSFLDDYKSTLETKAADVPFMQGVSPSKIEDYYWEKRQNKSTKEISYTYSIKYPFPSLEIKKMADDFRTRDAAIWSIYETLEAKLGNVTSLEQIDRAISELGPVIDYLFDDTRRNQASALRESYRKLYDNVTFRTVWQTLGEYRFQLMLDGRPIATSQRLTLRSECATQLTSEHQGEQIVVRYAYDGCAYDEENSVTVGLRIGGKAVSHKFYFTIQKYDVNIWPEKTVYLTAASKGGGTVSDIGIRMTVKSQHIYPYTINTLTLEIPGLPEPIFLDNLNTTFKKGESNLNVTWIGTAEGVESQNGRLNMLKGHMEVEIPDEEIVKRIDFALPFKANW